MKKILSLVAVLMITSSLFSQVDSLKTKTTIYASAGFSVSHMDLNDESINRFDKVSYPSIEIGFSRKSLSLGAVFGSENSFASPSTRIYYELKTAIYQPIGECSGYLLFGAGSYFESESTSFIEYGIGFVYVPKKLGYFVQYSNWARTNYISAGLTYNFN